MPLNRRKLYNLYLVRGYTTQKLLKEFPGKS